MKTQKEDYPKKKKKNSCNKNSDKYCYFEKVSNINRYLKKNKI